MPRCLFLVLIVSLCVSLMPAWAQDASPQISSPPLINPAPPDKNAPVAVLQKQADQLRAEKMYLDAMDYYQVALKKAQPGNEKARVLNSMGITELQMGRLKNARKYFDHSIKSNPQFPEPYNNLGAVYHWMKKYDKAIKYYEKAIALKDDSASFHANLGTSYFAKEEFEKASAEYARALQLDPLTFQRHSQLGIAAQLSSPEDRAHYYFVLAKMYAKAGMLDEALQALRHSMESGYKNIDDVYKENEFAGLRKDPRFSELMAQKPVAIPQ